MLEEKRRKIIKGLLVGLGLASLPVVINLFLPVKKIKNWGVVIGKSISNLLVAQLSRFEDVIELRLMGLFEGIIIGLRENNQIKKIKVEAKEEIKKVKKVNLSSSVRKKKIEEIKGVANTKMSLERERAKEEALWEVGKKKRFKDAGIHFGRRD